MRLHLHRGIGHYWCGRCARWVNGRMGRCYIDVIEVDRLTNSAYVAKYSGVVRNGVDTDGRNYVLPLTRIERQLNRHLPDGVQRSWVRMWWREHGTNA